MSNHDVVGTRPNLQTVFPGDHSRLDPPDPISNSEVKQTSADDSVGSPHVKVGHCQDFIPKSGFLAAFFLSKKKYLKHHPNHQSRARQQTEPFEQLSIINTLSFLTSSLFRKTITLPHRIFKLI